MAADAGMAALLLAAGESTRMGQPKALLPWHGKTLLQHQVAALSSAGVSWTIVVLGHRAKGLETQLKDLAGVQVVHNPNYRQGKTTSIVAGLRALVEGWDSDTGRAREGAVLLLNVDQPRSAGTIRRIIQLASLCSTDERGQSNLVTVPTYRGKGGHPIVLSTSLIPELMGITEDTMGMKAVVRIHEGETQRVELDAPEILLDLNTPEEYREALKSAEPI